MSTITCGWAGSAHRRGRQPACGLGCLMGKSERLMASPLTAVALLSLSTATPATAGALVVRTDPPLAKMLASLASDVVDTWQQPWARPPEEISLALRAKPIWSGVCAATVLRLSFAESPAGAPPRIEDVTTMTVYKVRADPDPNAAEDSQALAPLCAKDRPFQDGYFTAPGARMAGDVGALVQSVVKQAASGHPTFAVSCAHAQTCTAPLRRIANASIERISTIDEADHCRADHSCIQITFTGDHGCAEAWSVEAHYRSVRGKAWGVLTPLSLQLEARECPGPSK